MASIAPTFTQLGGGAVSVSWSTLANGDTGDAVSFYSHPDKTIQLIGTLSTGGTLTMQGSNDGTNWFTLTDTGGSDIVLTALGGKTVLENPRYIRPNITAGDGSTSLSVIALVLDK